MTDALSSQPLVDSALAQHLLVMIMGVAQTSVLYTAAQLDVADHLKDGLQSVAALAEATGTHPPTLARLLGVLVHLGLCAEPAPGQFTSARPVHQRPTGGLVANRCTAFATPYCHAHGRGVVRPDVAASHAQRPDRHQCV